MHNADSLFQDYLGKIVWLFVALWFSYEKLGGRNQWPNKLMQSDVKGVRSLLKEDVLAS